MAEAGPIPTTEATADERMMATLAHVLQIVGWWIAPLTVFLIKRDSKFVSFHALQALFLQIFYMVLMMLFVALWFTGFFVMIAHAPAAKEAPVGFFMLMPLIWLGWAGAWVTMLVIAILFGIKAGRGEWAEYPILGLLARRALNIGPRGVSRP